MAQIFTIQLQCAVSIIPLSPALPWSLELLNFDIDTFTNIIYPPDIVETLVRKFMIGDADGSFNPISGCDNLLKHLNGLKRDFPKVSMLKLSPSTGHEGGALEQWTKWPQCANCQYIAPLSGPLQPEHLLSDGESWDGKLFAIARK